MNELPESFKPVLDVLAIGGLAYAERHTLCVTLNSVMDQKIQQLREELEQRFVEFQNETEPKKKVDKIVTAAYND